MNKFFNNNNKYNLYTKNTIEISSDQKKYIRYLQKLLKFFVGIIFLPYFYFLLLLPEVRRPKFININVRRIGHFGGDFLIYFSLLNKGEINQNISFSLSKSESCNLYLYSLFSRNLRNSLIAKIFYYFPYKCFFIRKLDCKSFPSFTNEGSRDTKGITQFSKNPEFYDHENQLAKKWLKKHNYKDGQPIVCLLIRDPLYLSQRFSSENLSYHSYRNSSINTYKKSIEWLLQNKNAFVIRMGKFAEQKLNINHKSFLDYPFSDFQSDFIDIWLSINCDFFISTGTGLDTLSSYAGVPSIFVNFLPLAHAPSFTKSMVVPKILINKLNGQKLSFKKQCAIDFLKSKQFFDAKLEIKPLTEEQILESLKLGWDRLICKKDIILKDQKLKDTFCKVTKNSKLQGWINPEFSFHFFK